MKTLQEYIIEKNNEELFVEGKIWNGIKKVWNWLTSSKEKKYDYDTISDRISNYSNYKSMSFNRFNNTYLNSSIDFDDYDDENINNKNIETFVIENDDHKIIASLLYFKTVYNPKYKDNDKYNKYAYIFNMLINTDKPKTTGITLLQNFSQYLKKSKYANIKGFIIDSNCPTYKENEDFFIRLGFQKDVSDEENKILYLNYEDIY